MRSRSATGSANPARCNSAPIARSSAKGATRGAAPARISASPAVRLWRNSVSVSPPRRQAMNRPSGLSAWRIIDAVQREERDDKIAALRGQREALGSADETGAERRFEPDRARRGARNKADARIAPERRGGVRTWSADIDRGREFPLHQGQPVDEILRRATQQKIRTARVQPQRALEPDAGQLGVENFRGGHEALAILSEALAQSRSAR